MPVYEETNSIPNVYDSYCNKTKGGVSTKVGTET